MTPAGPHHAPGRVLVNGAWLFVPVLALNFALAGMLPAIHQPEIFWRDIPDVLGWIENGSRIALIGLAALMPFGWNTPRRRSGLLLYALGLVLYGASWAALILAPASGWSTSAPGLAAPAYLPALWLCGMWLAGGAYGEGSWTRVRPAFAAAGLVFLTAHLTHMGLVLWRAGLL